MHLKEKLSPKVDVGINAALNIDICFIQDALSHKDMN